VSVCVLVVLYWQKGRRREEGRSRSGRKGARTGRRGREGFAAVSLPLQLDPVVKAKRE
jgi:hypothetical protein